MINSKLRFLEMFSRIGVLHCTESEDRVAPGGGRHVDPPHSAKRKKNFFSNLEKHVFLCKISSHLSFIWCYCNVLFITRRWSRNLFFCGVTARIPGGGARSGPTTTKKKVRFCAHCRIRPFATTGNLGLLIWWSNMLFFSRGDENSAQLVILKQFQAAPPRGRLCPHFLYDAYSSLVSCVLFLIMFSNVFSDLSGLSLNPFPLFQFLNTIRILMSNKRPRFPLPTSGAPSGNRTRI